MESTCKTSGEKSEAQREPRRQYVRPQLVEHGKVETLTSNIDGGPSNPC